MTPSSPYQKLALIYDQIMQDVDYSDWTEYIDSLIRYHHPQARHVLELACGTGTMALKMERMGDYRITATDLSEEMIHIARNKARKRRSSIRWKVQDMRSFTLGKCFDIIFSVFDSINYLHDPQDILSVFSRVKEHLRKNGLFIFDFTTPLYSRKIAPLLNEEKQVGAFWRYTRKSEWNSASKIHVNHFFVEKNDPVTRKLSDSFEEIHMQKIWTLSEMKELVNRSRLTMISAYEDFDFSDASDQSDRITMILAHE